MTENQINYVKHLEDVRSHKANEAIAERNADENQRHNRQTEDIQSSYNAGDLYVKSQQNAINAASQLETVRSHKANEDIARATLAETSAHNAAQEAIGQQQAAASQETAEAQMLRAKATQSAADNSLFLGLVQRGLDREKFEHQQMVDQRTLDVAERNAATNEKNATTQRTKVVTDAIDGYLNYLIPKKGVERNGTGKENSNGGESIIQYFLPPGFRR